MFLHDRSNGGVVLCREDARTRQPRDYLLRRGFLIKYSTWCYVVDVVLDPFAFLFLC